MFNFLDFSLADVFRFDIFGFDFFQNQGWPLNLLDEHAFEANQRGQITALQYKKVSSGLGRMRVMLLVLAMVVMA